MIIRKGVEKWFFKKNPHGRRITKNIQFDPTKFDMFRVSNIDHSYDILGARMLWKPKEARILKNLKKNYRSTGVIW